MQVMGSMFYRHSQPSNDVIKSLFGEKIFENPKDHDIIARLVKYCTDDHALILDFFAGSGTTAHSVLDLNRKCGGNRNFILVQLPELTGRTDYPTISDICKDRVRRVIKKLNDEDAGELDMDGGANPDRGFRVFKLAESSFTTWDAQVVHEPQALEKQLDLHMDHIRENRTADDILYELLLKSGFPLTTPVEKQMLAGKTV